MVVTSVNGEDFLPEAVMFIRDFLLTNLTDPIAAKRSGDEKFVYTSYPQRGVKYPIVTVKGKLGPAQPLGQKSSLFYQIIRIEARVWATNEKDKDSITSSLFYQLTQNIHESDGTIAANLHDCTPLSSDDVDEDGDAGIKSKVSQFEYSFILGAT